MSLNNKLISNFNKLIEETQYVIDYLTFTKYNEDIINTYGYKLRAFKSAVSIIEKYPYKIRTGVQLQRYNGIGVGIIKRIDYILQYGKHEKEYPIDLLKKAYQHHDFMFPVSSFKEQLPSVTHQQSSLDLIDSLNNLTSVNDIVKNYPFAIKSKKVSSTTTKSNNDFLDTEPEPEIKIKISNEQNENSNIESNDDVYNYNLFGCFGNTFESIKKLTEYLCVNQTDVNIISDTN